MLTLYVNGDSHSATVYGAPGKTFASQLADRFSMQLVNRALPGGSNQRIIRTSTEDLDLLNPSNTVVLIGWTSFERAEWCFDGHWYNVAGSAAYQLPDYLTALGNRHLSSFWSDMGYCFNCHLEQHQAIWNFYNQLTKRGFRTLFFQGCKTFFFDGLPEQDLKFQMRWPSTAWAHNPYVSVPSSDTLNGHRYAESFSHLCIDQGFQYADEYQHFGQDAHDYWADFLQPKIQTLLN